MNILGLNVCGLISKINLGILEEYIKDYHIICLSETKTDTVEDLYFPGYKVIFCPRKGKQHKYGATHGLCVLVKTHIYDYTEVISNSVSTSTLWLKFKEGAFGKTFVLGATYIPHEGSRYYENDLFDDIATDMLLFDCPVLLIGDFNARTGLLSDFVDIEENIAEEGGLDPHSNDIFLSRAELAANNIITNRHNVDQRTNNNGFKLIELCKNLNIKIINGRFGSDTGIGEYTFHSPQGESTIDYAIASPSLLLNIVDFHVDPYDACLSDAHCAVCLALKFCKNSRSREVKEDGNYNINNLDVTEENGTMTEHCKTNWDCNRIDDYLANFSETNIQNLQNKLDSLNLNNLNQEDLDSVCSDLKNILLDPAKLIGMTKTYKKSNKTKKKEVQNKPWFSNECKNKRVEYIRIKNRLKKINTDEAKRELKCESKSYKKHIKQIKKTYFKDLHNNIRSLKSKKPKEYWNMINNACDRPKIVGNIALNTFMQHFKKLGQKDTENEIETPNTDPRLITHSINEDINKPFNFNEIKSLTRKLKGNKACGIDNIINEFVKHCPDNVLTLIVNLFNIVLHTGIIPYDWTIGLIVPLFKNKGDKNDPDNYRGISLLSCIGKLFTATINARLNGYLEAVGLLGEEQAGFRYGYSTTDHIFVLHSLIDIYLHSKKRLYCAFVDYKKAFDLVNRTSLWSKLLASNINGKILTAIINLYENAKSCVRSNGQLSTPFNCNIGVRQGDNLSPLLFAIYLNDLEFFLNQHYKGLDYTAHLINDNLSDDDVEMFLRMFVLLYADDTIVLAESPKELQKALNGICDYCKLWDLTVNKSKTKVVIFSKGKIRNKPKFTYDQEELEIVDGYVYLGASFNYNGQYRKAITKQVTQAKCAMFNLLSKVRKLELPVDVTCELFDKMITPIALYGCEIWGFEKLDYLESFYRKFLRIILKVNNSTPNCILYGEVGKYKLNSLIERRMINYWIRIVNGKHSKLCYTFYKLVKVLHESENNTFHSKWLDRIKSILDNCGLSDVWLNQEEINSNWLKLALDIRLKDIDIQLWQNDIAENKACVFYRQIKENFESEPYLKLLSNSERINLCKFRSGCHWIPLISGRYLGLEKKERLCNLCNSGQVGDEKHYLFECNFFEAERRRFVLLNGHGDLDQRTKQLFRCDDSQKLSLLAKFVKVIMLKFARQ